jgi:tRNA (guanine-N7-)-methyltransferase
VASPREGKREVRLACARQCAHHWRVNLRQREALLEAAARVRWTPADYFREADLAELFPRPAPLELDLGCGDGGYLVALARRFPERNFLGTERMAGRVEKVCRKVARARLENVRVLRLESHYVVKHLLPPACVTTAYVMHPDPWPKRDHHPRRLLQVEFMQSMHRVLVPGGEVCAQTDDLPYFQWMEKVWAQCPQFARLPWEKPEDWPQTDFERDYRAKGLPIYCARLRKL